MYNFLFFSFFPASAASSLNKVEGFGNSFSAESDLQLIMLSEKFQHCLQVMERSILGNTFQHKLAAYRQLPILEGKRSSFWHEPWCLSYNKAPFFFRRVPYRTFTHNPFKLEVKSDHLLQQTNGQNAAIWLNEVSRNVMNVLDPDKPVKPGTVERMEEVTDGPRPPGLEHLWTFSCELSRGHSVSSMAWNKKNPVRIQFTLF